MCLRGWCDCSDNSHRQPDPIVVYQPVRSRRTARQTNWAASEALGWGVATGVLAVATIAALIVPVDGPVGEIAAGSATAASAARFSAAWARMFGPALAGAR